MKSDNTQSNKPTLRHKTCISLFLGAGILSLHAMGQSPQPLFTVDLAKGNIWSGISVSDDGKYAVTGDRCIDLEQRKPHFRLDGASGQSVIVGHTAYSLSTSHNRVDIYDLDAGTALPSIALNGPKAKQIFSRAIIKAEDNSVIVLGNNVIGEVSKNKIYRISSETHSLVNDGYNVPLPQMKVALKMRSPVVGEYTTIAPSLNDKLTLYMLGSFTYQYRFLFDDINVGFDVLSEGKLNATGDNFTSFTTYPLSETKAKHNGVPRFPLWLSGFAAQCGGDGGGDIWMLATDLTAAQENFVPEFNTLGRYSLGSKKLEEKIITNGNNTFPGQWSATWTPDCRYIYLFNYDTRGLASGQPSRILQYDTQEKTYAKQVVAGATYTTKGDHCKGYQTGAVSQCGGVPCLLTVYASCDVYDDSKSFNRLEAYAIPWK